MSIHKLIDSFDIWLPDPDSRYRLEIFRGGEDDLFGYSVFSFHPSKTSDGISHSVSRRIFNSCQLDSYESAMSIAKGEIQKWHESQAQKQE